MYTRMLTHWLQYFAKDYEKLWKLCRKYFFEIRNISKNSKQYILLNTKWNNSHAILFFCLLQLLNIEFDIKGIFCKLIFHAIGPIYRILHPLFRTKTLRNWKIWQPSFAKFKTKMFTKFGKFHEKRRKPS